jgi:putative nucleotidyltransferase with HDIG domain
MPGLDDHNDRVLHLAERVARSLGITGADLDDLLHAAALHDVGKAAIPERILEKPGPLTSDERAFVQRHTIIGDRILAAAPALRRVGRIVRGSHERWDGAGYPDRLAGEEIPLASRIIAVCDAYDAMTEDRPYRSAMPDHEAAAELRRCAGTQFDPGVVDLFLDVVGAGDPRRLSTDIKSAGSVAEPPAMGAGPHEVIGT